MPVHSRQAGRGERLCAGLGKSQGPEQLGSETEKRRRVVVGQKMSRVGKTHWRLETE